MNMHKQLTPIEDETKIENDGKKVFRICARKYLLTYSQVNKDMGLQDLLEIL